MKLFGINIGMTFKERKMCEKIKCQTDAKLKLKDKN